MKSSRSECPMSQQPSGDVRFLTHGGGHPPLPPGPKRRRLRNLVQRLTNYPAFMEQLHQQYGEIVFFRMPRRNCCVVYDLRLVRTIFEDDGCFFGPGPAYSAKIPHVPNPALGSSFGEGHRWRAAVLGRAFTPECTRDYAEIAIDMVRELLDSWRDGEVIEVVEQMTRLTTGVTVAIGVGRENETDIEATMGLRSALKWDWVAGKLPLSELVRNLPLPGFARARRTFTRFDAMVDRAIARARRISVPESNIISQTAHSSGPDGRERPFTDRELRDEFTIFLLNAIGPPAQTLEWAIDYLAWNPVARRRLEAEVEEVAGGRPITAEDFDRIPYARAVFKETIRLAPIAFVADRATIKDCVLGGYRIPAGTILHPCMGLLHRSPLHFEEPLAFRPERWLEKPLRDQTPEAYMPFGIGPKTCIGRAFATRLCVSLLAALARQWRLEPVSRAPARPAFGPLGPYVVKDKLRMVVRRRS